MRKVFIILLLISITISAKGFKRYEFKSGKVVYQSSGSMTGTETMYFDDYGMLEVKHTDMSMDMMGIKQEIKTTVIMKDRWVYSIDEKTNTASKIENPVYTMFPNGVDFEKVGEEMMKKMGGKKVGNETINGKDCEVWEIEKLMSKVWIWKTIPIRTEMNMMGMNITQIATSIEVDVTVPASEFKIPAGIKIKDMGAVDYNKLLGN